MYEIAIQSDDTPLRSGRRQSFSARWGDLLKTTGHKVRLVRLKDPQFFDQLRGCDGFMWWFPHMPFPRRFALRMMLALDHAAGIAVFPGIKTVWHFDDKIAQAYLLQAAGIPTPRTWVLWGYNEAVEFCRNATYPLVIKLSTGIVSDNVRLVRDSSEVSYWLQRMFRHGLFALEGSPKEPCLRSLLRPIRDSWHRLRGPALGSEIRTDLQKNYFFAQEFLPGNAFDTRVTVIGNRAFAFRRHNRPNDFRASGSGKIDFDPARIDLDAVRLAFRVAQRLGTQSLAIDVLRRAGAPTINEISYYYEGWAVAECPGHWELLGGQEDGELKWVEGNVRPEDAILEDFLALVSRVHQSSWIQDQSSHRTWPRS